MSFEDLKIRIAQFLARYFESPDTAAKTRLKSLILSEFEVQSHRPSVWQQILGSRFAGGAFATTLGLMILGLWQMPFGGGNVLAGKIETGNGLVEIIRGSESFLVRGEADVYVGDWIRLGNKAEAQLHLGDSSVSDLSEKTKLQVVDGDHLFVERGKLLGMITDVTEISTDRGLVRGTGGEAMSIEVSETGETRISPTQSELMVFDLFEGHLSLQEGDQIVLRSDTKLSNITLPTDLNLSRSQLEVMAGKLSIARSKALTAVENRSAGNFEKATENLASAHKSFISIMQVLRSSREMEIATRADLSNIALEEVYNLVSEKTENKLLLQDIRSIEVLLNFLENSENLIAFGSPDTGVESFDRYVLLGYLGSLASDYEQVYLDRIADQYVAHFLRKIHNPELKIDQIALLNQEVQKLPTSPEAYAFLSKALEGFAPDLALILDQKIQSIF